MSKNFFVVVPYEVREIQAPPKIGWFKKPKPFQSLSEEEFQRGKTQLWQRMEFVALGLRRCGLQCIPLTTVELIELFWSLYHPEKAEVGYTPEIPPEFLI